MLNSKSISTSIQTQFNQPSNSSLKNTFNQSPSPHLSFNSKTSFISIKKTHNQLNTAASASATSSGIYTTFTQETLYDLLGISQGGTLCDIKRGYKQMALKYHPDVSPPGQVDEYTVRFIRVQEAYETLSDPETRAVYDCNLAKGLHLAFSVMKGSKEMGRWRPSWEVQVEELKRRSTVGYGGRMTWAARVRKQRVGFPARAAAIINRSQSRFRSSLSSFLLGRRAS
ncbi:hypothetical protein QVD17_17333 [Tagetes erecta]|uniref:J domain-containing protein n=1 Tax=Tagetes erecta TaxID=13708 RepID=A0AAD8KVT5_TARER|nr:hypothetical protein QVD17_17333 [Tagetes erecta]